MNSKRYVCFSVAILFWTACVGKADESPKAKQAPKPALDTVEVVPEPTFLGQLQSYFEQAQEAGTTTAASASHWLGDQYESASKQAQDTTNATGVWLSELYNGAVKSGDTTARNVREWVVTDVSSIGSWQYKVIRVPTNAGMLETKLNELGIQRWECISVIRDGNREQFVATMKRPHRSYLKQLPAKELLRLLPMLQGGDE